MDTPTLIELYAKVCAIQERLNDAEMDRNLILARLERGESGAKIELLGNAAAIASLKAMALALRIQVETRAA